MICPYNQKRKSGIVQWTQETENDGQTVSLQQIEYTDIIMQECPKEGCAVWYDGRCHYASASVD